MCMLVLAPMLLVGENGLMAEEKVLLTGENKDIEALYDSLDNAIAQTAQYVKERGAHSPAGGQAEEGSLP